MGSSLVTTPVRPYSDGQLTGLPSTSNLPMVRRPVEQANGQPRVEVCEIAAYDGELAQTLHARLDFSKFVNTSCSLSAADAYAVLAPSEFARFEVIASGLKSARNHERGFVNFALGTGAAVALSVASLAVFSGYPVPFQVFCDAIVGLAGLAVISAAAEGAAKGAKAAVEEIPRRLAALPAPQKPTLASNAQNLD